MTISNHSPALLSLLPIFYVAWSDTVLSPSELVFIKKKLAELKFLTEDELKVLESWMDPKNPPNEKSFSNWAKAMRQYARDQNHDSKNSLVQLGIEMAKAHVDYPGSQLEKSPKTAQALRDVQEAFGISPLIRLIIKPEHIEQIILDEDKSGLADQLQEILDKPYPDVYSRIRKLLRDPAFRLKHFSDKDEYRAQVLNWVKLMADQGLGAYAYPEKYGGKADRSRHIAVFETMAYHDLSLTVKFGVQFGLFGGAILGLGTEIHHDKYLSDVGSGQLLGCFAMTESNHGSNVKDLETTASLTEDRSEWVIHTPHDGAAKEYIGNTFHSQGSVVFAQLIIDGRTHGVHAFYVPMRDAQGQLMSGIRVEDNGYKLGLNGVDNGKIWYHQVRIPRENLLNKFGNVGADGKYHSPIASDNRRFFTMLGTLVAGRVSVALASLSVSKTALTIAIKYALQRRQFPSGEGEEETLLMDYPSHQKRLLIPLAKTYALHFTLRWLNVEYGKEMNPDGQRKMEAWAAGLKAYASWHAIDTVQECREACGGRGYLWENRFADLKADCDIFSTFEGDNTVLLQLVSKGLLSDFRKEFNEGGFMSVLRYLVKQVGSQFTDLNPIQVRKTDAKHLQDPQYHLDAFRYRHRRLLVGLAQRMRNFIRRKMSPHDAYLRCQNHIIELAIAYIELLILERFQAAMLEHKDRGVTPALENMYQIFSLSTMYHHRGWYLEKDFISPGKCNAIRRNLEKFIHKGRSHCELLVDAFAIPPESLAEVVRN